MNEKMIINKDIFFTYLKEAPLALALERTIEGSIYNNFEFFKPVLDIGCGEGMYAKILFQNKVDVGIDPNREEINRAKKYNAYNELICCYGDKIPKPDKSFSTIFSNSVLEHIPDLKPVLIEAHRLLADNGRFYVTIPTDHFEQNTVITKILQFLRLKTLETRYRKFFNRFWQHYHCYNITDWSKLFDECGFFVEKSITYCPTRVGIFNDINSPLASFAFAQKKFFNKWFILKFLRTPFALLYSFLYKSISTSKSESSNDGLVFFILKKH